ncbi:MAG TPA: urease accessory protein UreD [Verrucomicrobiae bacterium]|nr:urease accessory protein UreD [Verrucomicrobiae bacterium]
MVAPVTLPPGKAGRAALEVQLVFRKSTVISAFATSPMKLLTPRSRGDSVWACTSSFGGGLVAGDQTSLELQLGPETCCFLGTQASTKVYRNPAALPCGHETRAIVDNGAALVFAPDPVQAFAGASYAQRQEFNLASDANLVLLDWFTSGRAARGERWAFARFSSRNQVNVGGKTVFLDSLALDSADGDLAAPHRTGRFNCLAVLLLVGPKLHDAAQKLLAKVSAAPVPRQAALVFSASPIADGAVLRIAGEHVEAVGRELHKYLAPLNAFLGDDPWARKW